MERYQLSPQEQSVFEHLRQPFAVYQFVDKRVATLALSDGFCEMFGYTDREKAYHEMDNDMYRDTHPDDAARIANAALRFATEGGNYEVLYRSRIPGTSDYRMIHAFGEHVYMEDGVRLAHVWYSDEGLYMEGFSGEGSELNQTIRNALHENSLVKKSQYDVLTGLPNMSYFFELAENGKERIRAEGGTPALLYMDIRGMKFYNSKHGFVEGDKLLRSFAKLLANLFGNEQSCRIGADHFAVQTEEAGLSEKIEELLTQCRNINDGNSLPVHIGVYVAQKEQVHTSIACDRAKLACKAISGRYETAVHYYSEALSVQEEERQYIIENLDRALEDQWIQVYIQPIIRSVNERVCDVEALARWIDPEKGFLSPANFIPALEETGLIYRLDLYMVERVIDLIRAQQEEGFSIVPHSINLSRADFERCDIVEEVRRRVDDAGIPREWITIEITESVIGSDFEFMKEQVERFQQLGFPVWMDDFGSGYSSLDVLQSIRFDLLKFDMSFMRKLDEGDSGKVILTELMRMATSLGVDTLCEGVETEDQVRFLREIGCSKLQGFYFSRPVSFETIRKLRSEDTLIQNENPQEADYYERISRENLYDLGILAGDGEGAVHNYFDTLPSAVIEVIGDHASYVRFTRSYQEFMKRCFGAEDLRKELPLRKTDCGFGSLFVSVVKRCAENGGKEFFDEKMPDGSIIHSFAHQISTNPVTGAAAVSIAVLSVSEPNENETFADIAQALARDYYNIFVIDLSTNDYTEYTSRIGGEELSVVRHGTDFFESARRDTMTRIYEEDREAFLALFTKRRVLQDLVSQGVFTTTYRLIDTGVPMYVNMKITRMHGGNRIILGISIVDAHMRQVEEEKRLRQEKQTLGRIAALSPNFIVLYTVDPQTGHYTQFSPSNEFVKYGLARQGEDFFTDVRLDSDKAIAPEDIERHLRVLTKENMIREIHENGFFIHDYRMVMDGNYVPVRLKATMVEEEDGAKILLGVVNDENEEYRRNLEEAYQKASDTARIYTHIAHALARGYTDLFYVNVETGDFIEFHTDQASGVLTEARRGSDFYASCRREAKLYVQKEDQEPFLKAMNREFLSEALADGKMFEMSYKRIKEGRSFYVNMKVSSMADDPRFIVIAAADVDELIRKRRMEERVQEERRIYARLYAITGNLICVYVVDPHTGMYREFSSAMDYASNFEQAKEGGNFFYTLRQAARVYSHPEDADRILSALTQENVMEEIEQNGIFTLSYRLQSDGRYIHVQLSAAIVEEKEGARLVVGLYDIEAQVRQEKEYARRIQKAEHEANIDALTGVKNKHAYLETEAHMNQEIHHQRQEPFAVVVFDVNDLKRINDTIGHQAGDDYLREASAIICDIFKRSPVFRFGGDEFAVIAERKDYYSIEDHLNRISEHNREALQTGGIVIACGMAKYDHDACLADVFERADRSMYDNKNSLKALSEQYRESENRKAGETDAQ